MRSHTTGHVAHYRNTNQLVAQWPPNSNNPVTRTSLHPPVVSGLVIYGNDWPPYAPAQFIWRSKGCGEGP